MIFTFLTAAQRKTRQEKLDRASAQKHLPAKMALREKALTFFSRDKLKQLLRCEQK
jgi:hypothetical protein